MASQDISPARLAYRPEINHNWRCVKLVCCYFYEQKLLNAPAGNSYSVSYYCFCLPIECCQPLARYHLSEVLNDGIAKIK